MECFYRYLYGFFITGIMNDVSSKFLSIHNTRLQVDYDGMYRQSAYMIIYR